MAISRHQGKWLYEFWRKGTRYRGSGYATENQAIVAQEEAKKNIGKINTDFFELCNSRLDDVKLRRTEKYYKANHKLLKNLMKRWGQKREITRKDVEAFLLERAKTSSHCANNNLRLIKALFNHGVEREWFSYNPAGKVKLFPVKRSKKYIPTLEDILKVLAKAEPKDKAYLLTIIHTLARVGEINNLKWDDIKDGHLILRTRKARNSDIKERIIPINEVLKKAIEKIPKTGEYVFMNKRTKTKYDYRDKFLDTLCQKAEVQRFTFHCLRHFGASLLANQGEPLTNIQELLGHEKATTTDIYLQSLKTTLTTKKLEMIDDSLLNN